MNRMHFFRAFLLISIMAGSVAPAVPQEKSVEPQSKKEAPPPRTADGKRLFAALDTLRLRTVGPPRLSPDGQRVAYTVGEVQMDGEDKEWKAVTHVWVAPAGPGKGGPRQYTRGERSATAPEWSPDGKHLAFLSDREKSGERQVWMMAADGGEAWQVTTHKGGVSGFSFSPDGKKLLLSATDQPSKEEEARQKVKDDPLEIDRDFRMTHLWLWDLDKKEGKRLTEGKFTTSDPQWSPDGARIAYVARPTPRADDGGLSDLWVLTVATGERKLLYENPGSDTSPRWSPNGKWVAWVSTSEASGVAQSHLLVVGAEGGAPRKLTSSFDLNAGTPLWSPDGETIYFSANTRQAIEVYAVSVATGSVRQLSQSGGLAFLTEVSADGRTLVGTLATSERPGELVRTDATVRSFEALTNHNDWLKDYTLGAVEVIRWKSRDGTEIEGVLTKPVGFEPGRKYPLLLNPHGGPTAASLTGFDPTAQVLAANGYLVLQPNFRGSTGRGLAFVQANKNTWGKGDFEDCMTGVDAVIARGWADPARLGAFGWSYGGYMTFWILTQTDRFKAVSPGAGLTNIYSMYSQNDIQRYLRWFYADKSPWDNFELYWDRSPMKYIKQVKTPTLILHGQNDQRVPLAQAQEFYRGLVEQNVPVEFVVYPREGHGIAEPRHRLDRVRRYVYFFSKYLNTPVVTEPAKAGPESVEKAGSAPE